MKPASITWLRSRSNPRAAAIVFGLGEMIFPAFPPPESASSSAVLEIPILLPTDKAIGATISTATGINTPTAVIIIVASASARMALLPPNFFTIAWAIVSAAPDSIITPANTPAASTRRTVPMTLCVPLTSTLTVCSRLAPPISAPAIAPRNKE
ncbi:hypothetical protein D3C87_1592360 [compost metagenome]